MAREFYTNINFNGGAKITGLPAGAATGEAVTFEQLNASIEGIAWKDSVRVAAPTNVNLAAPGATLDGITMVAGDRFLAPNQTTVTQNGIYVWNGAAVAATRSFDATTFSDLEGAVVTIEEGTSAGATYRQTQVNGVIGTNNVVWTSFGGSAPAASETTAGIAELATQAETDAGTDDLRMVTPLKLATYAGRKLKFAANVGDGSALTYNFDHNFATRDVTVEVFRNSGNFDTVIPDVTRPSTNRVTLGFATAPGVNAYRVVISG
jgi:hypothetical protein